MVILHEKTLNYTYCDDYGTPVYYNENYVQSASVTKIGNRYQFEFILMPNHFTHTNFFPAGNHNNENGIAISLKSTNNNDIAIFSVSEDFIFKNPVNRKYMIFELNPILTAFPDDFKFAEGCRDNCILLDIETAQLPK